MPTKPASKRCSSGPFKGSQIIRQIVGRVHVADPDAEAVSYARSRLAAGAWDGMSAKDRKAFDCEVIKQHRANQKLYTRVMRGGLGRRKGR